MLKNTTNEMLEDIRCIGCQDSNFQVKSDKLFCNKCHEEYPIIDDIPFITRFQPDETLSLIEILSAIGMDNRLPPTADSYRLWTALLKEYHFADEQERETLLEKATGGIKSFLPHRYRQYELFRTLIDQVELAGKKTLEVGAGEGFCANLLYDFGLDVTAVEFNPISAKKGMDAVPSVRWIGGSVHALPFEDESFDLVVAQAALHHFTDIPQALRELCRVCKVGGTILTIGDSYRNDKRGEDFVVKQFNNDPMVLAGVNENIPPFSDFVSLKRDDDADVDIKIITSMIHNFPENGKRTPLKGIRQWSYEKHGSTLGDTDGGVSCIYHKNASFSGKAAMLSTEVASPLLLVANTSNKEVALATLGQTIVEEYVNLPFPGVTGNSKFELLNGWQAKEEGDEHRALFKRGRRFYCRTEQQTLATFQIMAPSSKDAQATENDYEDVEFSIFLDSVLVASSSSKRDQWIDFAIPVSSISANKNFVLEIVLNTNNTDFAANRALVKGLSLS